MELSPLIGLISLYIIGLMGWFVASLIRLPVPALLGSLLTIGLLRALDYNLPNSPSLFFSILQMLLGFYVGNMITKDTILQIKKVFIPAGVVMAWVLVLTFAAGLFLSLVTFLDPLTSILASSTGGLPEMIVIAVDTHANSSIIVILQLARIFAVLIGFPLLLRYLKPDAGTDIDYDDPTEQDENAIDFNLKSCCVSLIMALTGGTIFLLLNIPAGGMVGAISFVVLGTVSGYNFQFPSRRPLNFLLVGVGIMVAENMTPAVGRQLISGSVLAPVVISTVITVLSSLLLAKILTKISSWDYFTCLLAAAPAGLSVMVALAIEYNRDPMPVFMIHICRVLILKTAIPLAIMFIL